MSEEIVRFTAEHISIKPPKKDGSLSVELFTGIYSIPGLAQAYLWQAKESNFEIYIRPVSPKQTGFKPHESYEEGTTMAEEVVEEKG
jgi:hypothetical protein